MIPFPHPVKHGVFYVCRDRLESEIIMELETTNLVTTNAVASVMHPSSMTGVAILLAVLPWVLMVALGVLCVFVMPRIQNYMAGVKPVIIDGTIAMLVTAFIFSQMFFSDDSAYHYVNIFMLYWLKYGFGLGAAVLMALKNFRSTDYAAHLQNQKDVASGKVTETVTEVHTEAKLSAVAPLQPAPVTPLQAAHEVIPPKA